MRYHGNYCGPNWSAGQYQASVISDVQAVDEFDATCREHDAAYALHGDLGGADQKFYESNMWKGPKRSLAAIAVKVQKETRDKMTKSLNQRLRGASTPNPQANNTKKAAGKAQQQQQRQQQRQSSTVEMPATIGTILRGSTTKTTRRTESDLRMTATVCVGKPVVATQAAVPELTGLIVLNPVSLGSDEIQNMARVYQRYRIHRAKLHYRPIVSTANGGETIVVSNADPNFKPIDTSLNSSFYQRALSTNHSLLSPIWMPSSMDLDIDNGIKVCDNLNSSTLEDFCSGIVYTYQDTALAAGGYFLIELDIEFFGLRFNPRNVISGSRQGFGVRSPVNFLNPVLGATATSTNVGFTGGDIYLAVLTITGSAFAAPVTAANLFTLSTGTGTLPFLLDGSTALYARAQDANTLVYFATYDAAVGFDVGDRLQFGVTAPATTSIVQAVLTQLRNSTQPSL